MEDGVVRLRLRLRGEGDFQFLADVFGRELLNFPVTWNRLNFLIRGIFPNRVIPALAGQQASVRF